MGTKRDSCNISFLSQLTYVTEQLPVPRLGGGQGKAAVGPFLRGDHPHCKRFPLVGTQERSQVTGTVLLSCENITMGLLWSPPC